MRGHARGKTWLICTTCRNGSASGGGGGGGQHRARSPPRAILYSALTVPCRPIHKSLHAKEVFRLVVQFRVHISRMRTPTGLRTSHVAANSKCATLYYVRI